MARLFSGLLLLSLCGPAWAAPPLSTVQDMLYKADGTPFSGFVLIDWRSFEAVDLSNIATHNLTVPIIKGVLRVQLVPTTNAATTAYYRVRYNSDGKVQFEETWAVPPSTLPLRLKDVRIAGVPGGSTDPPPPVTEIQESDVVGLVEDLALRPVKGAGYAPSRAAYIGASGELEAVVGNLEDCVRVDGTAGPCGTLGSAGPAFTDAETPAGLINGSNAVFTLADTPDPLSSLALYRNGLLQRLDGDYTIAGNVITFLGGVIPQPGDVLAASYRIADASQPLGLAGGALTGSYPNPALALGIVADANVAEVAGIRESKLALDYPTHSNANDPNADQKAAFGGTAGTPSASNRFVTDMDPRLSDLRTPVSHGLLSPSHADALTAAPVRGDLVAAQGTAPTSWTRLPIGPANRCLISNGFDAVWNTCLYTGFTPGTIPFVDATGNLAQSNSKLVWDNLTRKLSIGNDIGATTLYLYDATPGTGATGLTVRAGDGQGTDPLQRWLTGSGLELARVDAEGRISAPAFRATTSASRAAWRDAGNVTDPSPRADGDFWYNTTAQARRTVEGGQVHSLPQVLCSSTGVSTSSSSITLLGSCTIPAGLLKAGDRVDLRFDYFHDGGGTGFSFEVRWGGTSLVARDGAASEVAVTGRADAAVHGSGAQWSVQTWGTTLGLAATTGSAGDSVAAPIVIYFFGRMAGATAESVALRNFTVVRYPAIQNP